MAADIQIMGQAYTDVLTVEQQDALHIACSILPDNFFGNIIELGQNVEFAATELGSYLPQRYLPFYSLGFAKEFMVTFTTVCWKLAQPQRLKLSSLAAELSFVGLLAEANEPLDSLREEDRKDRSSQYKASKQNNASSSSSRIKFSRALRCERLSCGKTEPSGICARHIRTRHILFLQKPFLLEDIFQYVNAPFPSRV